MWFYKPVLTVFLILTGVLQISSTDNSLTRYGNDYIVGELTPKSVLAHT